MSRSHDLQRTFLPFGNPFRMIKIKGSKLSPKLLDLLNTFEEALAGRLKKLKPVDKKDVLSLSWMRSAMELLCNVHADIKVLITALELPVCDWDDKWIDVYLDNSVKLLDICIAFGSEISRLKQGHLFLQCALHKLAGDSSKQPRSSLNGWKQHVCSNNPRLDKCFSIMDCLFQTLDLPTIKNSSKGKVLMQAMYGVKAVTLFICTIFAAAFSGSSENLIDLQVPERCLWAEAFADLQTFVNTEIRNSYLNGVVTVVQELKAVDIDVKKLYLILEEDAEPIETEALQMYSTDLESSAEKLSGGLDLLAKEVDSFFQVVLSGRDALLCNLRADRSVFDGVPSNFSVDWQAVR